ncbi:MAG TPA: hypothetical protein PK059_09155 [Cyclobacteriaceae bacterium]|nr:hypothetical protein [Cyclobacteriaceae bacterium]
MPKLSIAQQPEGWEKADQGEIKDVEIQIVKDRKIVLPVANRGFEKVPQRPYEPIQPAITYQPVNFTFTTSDYKPTVRPLKLSQEEIAPLYGNYLSAGAGNYGSLFAEGAISTKRDRNKFLSAHLINRSFGTGPVDGKNSASSAGLGEIFGKWMGSAVTVSGRAGADWMGLYFYGYQPATDFNRDNLRQTWTNYQLQIGLENTKPGDFNYKLTGSFGFLQDHYRTSESQSSVALTSTYRIADNKRVIIDGDLFFISRKDSMITNADRQLFRVKPSYQFEPLQGLQVTAGANVAIQSDSYAGSKSVHVYPNLKAVYNLTSALQAYGWVTGDIDKVALNDLRKENTWVDSNLPITNTNRALEFRTGLQGKLGRQVSVHAGVAMASLKNLYFYQTIRDNLTPGGANAGVVFDKFMLVYDRDTRRVNPFAEVSLGTASAFYFLLRGDYFTYDTDILLDAWHRPTYRVSTQARYNLYDKITVEAGLVAQGGVKTFDPGSNTIKSLDPALDMSVKARYFVSKQVSAFLHGNNLLSSKYPLYQSYNSRGTQVLLGVSWSF